MLLHAGGAGAALLFCGEQHMTVRVLIYETPLEPRNARPFRRELRAETLDSALAGAFEYINAYQPPPLLCLNSGVGSIDFQSHGRQVVIKFVEGRN
jgi:hypothetical protein